MPKTKRKLGTRRRKTQKRLRGRGGGGFLDLFKKKDLTKLSIEELSEKLKKNITKLITMKMFKIKDYCKLEFFENDRDRYYKGLKSRHDWPDEDYDRNIIINSCNKFFAKKLKDFNKRLLNTNKLLNIFYNFIEKQNIDSVLGNEFVYFLIPVIQDIKKNDTSESIIKYMHHNVLSSSSNFENATPCDLTKQSITDFIRTSTKVINYLIDYLEGKNKETPTNTPSLYKGFSDSPSSDNESPYEGFSNLSSSSNKGSLYGFSNSV